MAQATDQQMQRYADDRIRVRAEQLRAIVNAFRDDRTQIADVFERANGGAAWNDARTDGPPNLLNSQDVLNFDAVSTLFLKCIDGTATAQNVIDFHANFLIFQTACVRPA